MGQFRWGDIDLKLHLRGNHAGAADDRAVTVRERDPVLQAKPFRGY